MSTAAREAGKSRQAAYALRERPGAASFAAAWDRALALPLPPPIGPTVWQPISEGVAVRIIYRGRVVGHRRRFSSQALRNILRAR